MVLLHAQNENIQDSILQVAITFTCPDSDKFRKKEKEQNDRNGLWKSINLSSSAQYVSKYEVHGHFPQVERKFSPPLIIYNRIQKSQSQFLMLVFFLIYICFTGCNL